MATHHLSGVQGAGEGPTVGERCPHWERPALPELVAAKAPESFPGTGSGLGKRQLWAGWSCQRWTAGIRGPGKNRLELLLPQSRPLQAKVPRDEWMWGGGTGGEQVSSRLLPAQSQFLALRARHVGAVPLPASPLPAPQSQRGQEQPGEYGRR